MCQVSKVHLCQNGGITAFIWVVLQLMVCPLMEWKVQCVTLHPSNSHVPGTTLTNNLRSCIRMCDGTAVCCGIHVDLSSPKSGTCRTMGWELSLPLLYTHPVKHWEVSYTGWHCHNDERCSSYHLSTGAYTVGLPCTFAQSSHSIVKCSMQELEAKTTYTWGAPVQTFIEIRLNFKLLYHGTGFHQN